MELSRNSKMVFYIYTLCVALLIEALLIAFYIFIFYNHIFNLVTQGIFCIIFSLFYFYYLPRYVDNYKINFSKSYITVQKGFLFSKEVEIEKNKILYSTLVSNPLQRLFGICSIVLFAPGIGRIILSQLTKSQALYIKEKYLE